MVTFQRSQVVGAEFLDDNTIRFNGIQEDHIYGMEISMEVRIDDGTILRLQGNMKRYTNFVCPQAISVLPSAVGLSLREAEWDKKVMREIGRKGCEHLAEIIIECGRCLDSALLSRDLSQALKENPELGSGRFSGRPTKIEGPPMLIDLHVHTSPRSPCSNINPAELIQEAKRIGLDGFCLTEHQVMWDWEEVVGLAGDEGIRIFRGNEITTAQGDVLVFGLERNVQGIITIQELHQIIQSEGGFSIAAHPFRGFKMFGVGQLGLTLDQACKKKSLQFVDAVEIRNGRVTEKENEVAGNVAERLGLLGTAGSDAHEIGALGTWVTIFEKDIDTEADLLRELKAGNFTVGSAR